MDKLFDISKKLHTKYFLPGHYIINLPSNFNYKLKFDEIYNSYLKADILECTLSITLLDIPLEVVIHKPLRQVHRYEFEEHFGFKNHCDNFDPNKKIIYCPKYPTMALEELLKKIDTKTNTITNDKIKELCLLMILGGYWNKKQAIADLLIFSESVFGIGIGEIKVDNVFEYLFHYIQNITE